MSIIDVYRADKSEHIRAKCDCGSRRIRVTDRKADAEARRTLKCLDCGRVEETKGRPAPHTTEVSR